MSAFRLTYECQDKEVTVPSSELSFEGGCIGHSDDDPYCYCPSIRLVLDGKCGSCGFGHDFDTW